MARENPDPKVEASLEKFVQAGFLFEINNVGGGACSKYILALSTFHEDYGEKKEVTVIVPYPDHAESIGINFHYEDPGREPKLKTFATIRDLDIIDIELTDNSKYRVFQRYPRRGYNTASRFLDNIRKNIEREASFFSTIHLNMKGKFLSHYRILNPKDK